MYFKKRRVHSGTLEGLGENMQKRRLSRPGVLWKDNTSLPSDPGYGV